VKRSKNRSDVTRFWGSGDSTSKRILDVLESFYVFRLGCIYSFIIKSPSRPELCE